MPRLLAYSVILSVAIAIAIAAYRGLPILHVFAPVRTWTAFWLSLTALVVTSELVAVQLRGRLDLFSQPPMAWAILVALIYCWATIVYQVRRS
jgi:hypothetical protein